MRVGAALVHINMGGTDELLMCQLVGRAWCPCVMIVEKHKPWQTVHHRPATVVTHLALSQSSTMMDWGSRIIDR